MSDNQIQCPNCGGYDIEPSYTGNALEIIFTLLGFMIYLLPGILMKRSQVRRDWGKFLAGENTAVCKLCKYEFWISQVPIKPIQPNNQLIQAGRKRIEEEEEEARRRRHFDD